MRKRNLKIQMLNNEDVPVGQKIKTLAEIIRELSEQLLKEVTKKWQ